MQPLAAVMMTVDVLLVLARYLHHGTGVGRDESTSRLLNSLSGLWVQEETLPYQAGNTLPQFEVFLFPVWGRIHFS